MLMLRLVIRLAKYSMSFLDNVLQHGLLTTSLNYFLGLLFLLNKVHESTI